MSFWKTCLRLSSLSLEELVSFSYPDALYNLQLAHVLWNFTSWFNQWANPMSLTMGISKEFHHFSQAPLFPPRKKIIWAVVNSDLSYVIMPEDFRVESFNIFALYILANYSKYLLQESVKQEIFDPKCVQWVQWCKSGWQAKVEVLLTKHFSWGSHYMIADTRSILENKSCVLEVMIFCLEC